MHWLRDDQSWSDAKELPILGAVIDQDMGNMRHVQRGIIASAHRRVQLGPTGKPHPALPPDARRVSRPLTPRRAVRAVGHARRVGVGSLGCRPRTFMQGMALDAAVGDAGS